MAVINHVDDAEVQAFIDAEDEALNEEERLLMDGPDFTDAIENAFQQGLEAGHAGLEIAHPVRPSFHMPLASPCQHCKKVPLPKHAFVLNLAS